ncbi:HTH-type transcriptional repressor NsrR [compost metagenome]
MILRNQVEWALHCCAVLTGLEPGQYLATKDLAEFHGVPKEYLSKALQSLSQAKLVVSTLGPTGGYRLSREAKDISFLEVVEAIEGKISTFECSEIRKNNPCLGKFKPTGVCAVARVMYRADEAYKKELRNTSLADLFKQVVKDVPAEILEQNAEWFANRR